MSPEACFILALLSYVEDIDSFITLNKQVLTAMPSDDKKIIWNAMKRKRNEHNSRMGDAEPQHVQHKAD